MKECITINLKSLRFHAFHGWHEEERKTGNEFEVDVFLIPNGNDFTGSIHQTIDYVQAYEIIKEQMKTPEHLLETVAIQIAARLKETFPQLQEITISIKKLTAPIINFSGSVGVTYKKEY